MNLSHRQLRPFVAAASLPSLSRAAEACHLSQPTFSRALRDIVWPRASHIVWLNFSRAVVFSRIVRRTVRRSLFREPLWHGNRESITRAFFSKDSIILWSLSTYHKNRAKYRALRESGAFGQLQWHELRTPAEADRFLSRARGFTPASRRSPR